MLYKRFQDTPYFVSENYLEKYNSPFKETSDPEDYLEEVYVGTGISPEHHPLQRINYHSCGNCQSKNIKIIYARWCVSPHSGDAYWDYEAFCEDCHKFTQCSYNEND